MVQKQQKQPITSPDTAGLLSLFSELDVEDDGRCSGCGMVFSQEDDEDRF